MTDMIGGIHPARQAQLNGYIPILRETSRTAIMRGMSDDTLLKLPTLKKALIEATGPGKSWTRRGLSLAIGMGPDWVRDILSGRNKSPSAEAVAGVASKLGLPIDNFFDNTQMPAGEPRQIPFVGTVAAGVWREASHIEEPREPLLTPFDPPKWAKGKRFALVVEGESMNKVFPPGSFLDCVDVISAGFSPQPGQYVIVERNRSGLREMTAKKLMRRDDGDWELRAESYSPEFGEPIHIGHPDTDLHIDSETRILGVVVGNYRPYV